MLDHASVCEAANALWFGSAGMHLIPRRTGRRHRGVHRRASWPIWLVGADSHAPDVNVLF